MNKFWLLLAIAFADLVVALFLAHWGHRSLALGFLLIAALMGGYALFSTPGESRDPRGRLRHSELPYGGVLGTAGAIAIMASAAYVAFISSRPPLPETRLPAQALAVPRPAAAPVEAYQPPRSFNPSASTAALYKCVDARGHASYQSQPCPADATQAWVRDATPEPPPSRSQLARQAEARRAAERQAAYAAANSNRSYQRDMGSASPGESAACQAARSADAAYRRQPLQYVTHDGLRQHGDRIQEACY